LNGIDVATQDIASNPDMDIVSISVAPNFLIRWLLPHLHRFQSRYPDVELQIHSDNNPVDLNKTSTDMAVYFGDGNWHDIEAELLFKVSLVPVCSSTFLSDDHPLDTPRDLHHYPLIHVSKRLYEWPEWLHACKIEYSGFSRGLQLSSSQLATTAARESLGIALADRTLSSQEIDDGRLIVPFDILLDSQRSFYLVHSKNVLMTYGMRVFKEWVIEEVQSDISEKAPKKKKKTRK
jgi:LysR family glycine cleavage system transcriptional activator